MPYITNMLGAYKRKKDGGVGCYGYHIDCLQVVCDVVGHISFEKRYISKYSACIEFGVEVEEHVLTRF